MINFEMYKMVVIKSVVVAVMFFVVAYVFVYPQYSRYAKLVDGIRQAESDLIRQRIFYPEYSKLQKVLDKADSNKFPMPRSKPLPLVQAEQLVKSLEALAYDSNLEPLDVIISPSSLKDDPGKLMLQCVVSGQMTDFRMFFLSLNRMEYLHAVEKVEMQAVPGGLECFVQLWIQVS